MANTDPFDKQLYTIPAPGTKGWVSRMDDSMLKNFKPADYSDYGGDGRIDEEHRKQMAAVRARYPMLTQLILNGPAALHANLSSPEDTNKYARLADAYNAKYMRKKGTFTTSGFDGGFGNWTPGGYEAINKLSTQDQAQMEQRIKDEALLHNYLQGEESWFQRQVWNEKMKEQWKYLDQETKELFYAKNEEMRRASEMFDIFARMSATEYAKYYDQIKIPYEKVQQLDSMFKKGHMLQAAMMMDSYGMDPIMPDQYITLTSSENAIKLANAGDYRGAFIEFNKIKATDLTSKIAQLIEVATNGGQGVTRESISNLVGSVEKLANGASGVAGFVGDHTWGVIFAAIAALIAKEGADNATRMIGAALPALTMGMGSDMRIKHIIGRT